MLSEPTQTIGILKQVFLGMAASFVPPKRDIVDLIEDVEAAGVRFVYFSPRNMRRSKVQIVFGVRIDIWTDLDNGCDMGRMYASFAAAKFLLSATQRGCTSLVSRQ